MYKKKKSFQCTKHQNNTWTKIWLRLERSAPLRSFHCLLHHYWFCFRQCFFPQVDYEELFCPSNFRQKTSHVLLLLLLSHFVMSDSVWPHRMQPTRLLHPWDSPGKNTGVGCHFLLQCMKVKSKREVTQSCLTLSDPMDCSLPGSSVMGFSRKEYWSEVPLPSPSHVLGTE